MKAIVYRKYGGPEVLRYEEVEKPVPKENEVLIKVHFGLRQSTRFAAYERKAGATASGDGFAQPRSGRLGVDMAGQVEAVGKTLRPVAA